ncbi:MAG TPA: PilW family protein [Marinobacter sp.]|uniref:PilW family protein n=1 Tax=Marinobacter sp. TaxID=50741 RepID=UPI002D7F66E5|nr:PilW family protein [Marinobacter sp.]HET8801859.1 PilW family protein [Marinobacter sp.]
MSVLYRQQTNRIAGQTGLSLVELIIALALGVVLTLGVAQVFLGSSKTYRTSDAIAYLQENLRFSLSRISRDVRMAGNTGCLVGEPTNHLDTTSAAYNSTLWDSGRAVVGWEAPNTGLGDEIELTGFSVSGGNWSNGTSDTAPVAITNNAIAGTDFVVLSGNERADVELDGNPSPPATTIGTSGNTGIDQGTIVVVVLEDCSGGDRFQKTNSANSSSITRGNGGAPGNTNAANLNNFTDDASVYLYRSRGYFIGLGVNNEPALFRVALTPGESGTPVELVSGVESMQILYGIANSEPHADRYVDASSVTNWSDVVSVRVAMLMRSGNQIMEEDNSQTFNLVGTEVDPGADRRARLVATTTTGVRNRLE